MTSYLEHGWYADEDGRTRLRTEVIDGAMDVAGMLLRAGVPAHRILRVALKVRSLVVIADPLMRGTSRFGERDRLMIAGRVELLTDGFPELQSFVNDCLENVNGAHDMTAFYLHLVHVTRMMQLLSHAAGFSGLVLEASQKTKAKTKPSKAKKKAKKTKKATKKTTKKAKKAKKAPRKRSAGKKRNPAKKKAKKKSPKTRRR